MMILRVYLQYVIHVEWFSAHFTWLGGKRGFWVGCPKNIKSWKFDLAQSFLAVYEQNKTSGTKMVIWLTALAISRSIFVLHLEL